MRLELWLSHYFFCSIGNYSKMIRYCFGHIECFHKFIWCFLIDIARYKFKLFENMRLWNYFKSICVYMWVMLCRFIQNTCKYVYEIPREFDQCLNEFILTRLIAKAVSVGSWVFSTSLWMLGTKYAIIVHPLRKEIFFYISKISYQFTLAIGVSLADGYLPINASDGI